MFKVGQKVWCVMFGEGVVARILTPDNDFQVVVDFDGKQEHYTLDGKYCSWSLQVLFSYPVEITKKVTKPSINWEHVDSKYNYLAEDPCGAASLYEEEPFTALTSWGIQGGEAVEAFMFASYVKGTCDWKESLVKRPEN